MWIFRFCLLFDSAEQITLQKVAFTFVEGTTGQKEARKSPDFFENLRKQVGGDGNIFEKSEFIYATG